MQQTSQSQSGSGEYANLTAIERHLERLDERLDERTRNLATRQDLEALRKEMVTRDLFESQFSLFKSQLNRMEQDRTDDRKETDERFEKVDTRFESLKNEQASRSERFWMRISPIIAGLAFLIALLQFLSHVRFTP